MSTTNQPPRSADFSNDESAVGKFSVDLNCDMGEGMSNEAAIMPYISSANIACGYHAGDPDIMWSVVELAVKHDVSVGAHVSFFDRDNFGRTELNIPAGEIYELVEQQLIIMYAIADSLGVKVRHVKPHGALYNMSAREAKIARAIAHAVNDMDNQLVVFGLSNSHSIAEAKLIGLQTCSEVFADRTYSDDGTLTPRSAPGALITDSIVAVNQAVNMVKHQQVQSATGATIPVIAETICLHGDAPQSVEFAAEIHRALHNEGISIRAKER